MAMNKAERATYEGAVAALESARSMRWPEYDKPAQMTRDEIALELKGPNVVDAPSWNAGSTRKAVVLWTYNTYSGLVSKIASDGNSTAGLRYDGKVSDGWSRSIANLYRTKEEALHALRYELTVKYAEQLARIDRMIRDAEPTVKPVPVDHDGTPFKLLPVDLETHLGDFESAVKAAMSESFGDSRDYWKKQLTTIDRIKESLRNAET